MAGAPINTEKKIQKRKEPFLRKKEKRPRTENVKKPKLRKWISEKRGGIVPLKVKGDRHEYLGEAIKHRKSP